MYMKLISQLLSIAALAYSAQVMAAPAYTATTVHGPFEPNMETCCLEVKGISETGRVYGYWTTGGQQVIYLGAGLQDRHVSVVSGLTDLLVEGDAFMANQRTLADGPVLFFDGSQEHEIQPLGGRLMSGVDFNAGGQVVGNANDRADYESEMAWMYQGGNLQVLAGLRSAVSIDDQGRVLGWSSEAGHEGELALWADGSLTYGDLALPETPPALPVPSAYDIVSGLPEGLDSVTLFGANGKGQLAALACADVGGSCAAIRLDLVSAVPEPSSVVLAVSGFAFLGVLRQRRKRS
jgi:hypothetical protein